MSAWKWMNSIQRGSSIVMLRPPSSQAWLVGFIMARGFESRHLYSPFSLNIGLLRVAVEYE